MDLSSQSKLVELKPIKESTEDYEAVERQIRELFKKHMYLPLLRILGAPAKTLVNAADDALMEAIRSGRVTFSRGTFAGKFNSSVSKQLKALGATFDRKQGVFKIGKDQLPEEIRQAISASEFQFTQKLEAIDRKIAQILPEEIAGRLSVEKHFDRALWKVESDFKKSVKSIGITPELSDESRARIAQEWQNNLKLYIKDFTEKETASLREEMQTRVFTGNRYQDAVKTIQKSYDVTANKAKFLARQETSLLMTKYKQVRYEDAGIEHYRWGTVAGSKNHPVRPWHKALEGKIFKWDSPPITTEPGKAVRRNNPGQDYNCRCFARPVVIVKK